MRGSKVGGLALMPIVRELELPDDGPPDDPPDELGALGDVVQAASASAAAAARDAPAVSLRRLVIGAPYAKDLESEAEEGTPRHIGAQAGGVPAELCIGNTRLKRRVKTRCQDTSVALRGR